jgi:CheY-like chemotaxis protein
MQILIDEGVRSVLIVEDEMIVAMMMEDLVRSLGAQEVHICPDTASALEIINTKQIDCAVLDLRVLDGTTTAVADALALRGIPFLFSSGSELAEMEARYADRPRISKPFMDDDFKMIVLDTLTLGRSQASLPVTSD